MDKLLVRLAGETSAKFILMTPSPFDQMCVNNGNNNQPGCNDGLDRCAEIVRQLASKYKAEVVDLNGPMTALNLERQKSDPAYTLIGHDRIHPGMPGNLMMAWLFLKAQQAPSLVSNVTLDAAAGRAAESANATVTNVKRNGNRWTFTVLEKALPCPVDAAARGILAQISFEKDLNQEIVQIKGLADGSYVLAIDGAAVCVHTAAQWAQGVNLAFNVAAPQVK